MDGPAVTLLLQRWRSGDDSALEALVPQVYDQLRAIAHRHLARERAAQLETAELVHMAYERLIGTEVDWVDRAHFFAIAARTMRRVLVDQARARGSQKRGGGVEQVTLSTVEQPTSQLRVDLLDLDEALDRLAERHERKAGVVECFYFGGLTHEEIAAALDISVNTVKRDLRFARAWLIRTLEDSGSLARAKAEDELAR